MVVALFAVLVAWRLSNGPAAEADAPVGAALVTLAPVEAAPIDETVIAYGVVTGSPEATRTIATPRAVVVERLLTAPGRAVKAGAPLIVLANTPATELAARQAGDAVTFAQRDLERVQRLYDARLAANDQLDAARKALADARAVAMAQTRSGASTGHQTITAPVSGTVGAVAVSLGEHVGADAPLMTLVATGGLIAQLALEPEQARRVAPGRPALIASAFDPPQSAPSRVATVGRLVDPTTHLVAVTVPAGAAGLALGASVRGAIIVAEHTGLRAPRAAIVYDEAGAHVFVIRSGKARQTPVKTGAELGENVEVSGDLHAGDSVAVAGAYQLQDGWPVRTAPR